MSDHTKPQADAASQVLVFAELAEHADDLAELLMFIIGGNHEFLGAAHAMACRMGWLCDAAVAAQGGEAYRGDAKDWFLSPSLAGALEAMRHAADSEECAA